MELAHRFNKTCAIVFIILLMDIIASGLFTAVIMHLLIIEDTPSSMHRTAEDVLFGSGFLVTLSPAFLLGTFILGYCSDIFGRKPALIFCLLCNCFGYALALCGLVTNTIFIILLGLVLLGIGGSTLSLTLALLTDMSSGRTKALMFAVVAIAMNILVVAVHFGNQLLPYFVSNTHYYLLLLGFVVLEIINLIIVNRLLTETNTKIKQGAYFSVNKIFSTLALLLSKKRLIFLLGIFFIFEFAYGIYTQYIFNYLTIILHGTPQNANWFVDYRTSIMLFSLVIIYPLLIHFFSIRRLLIYCLAISCIGLLGASLLATVNAQWYASLLIAIGFAMIDPILWTLLSNCTSRAYQGLILGLTGPVWLLAWMTSGIVSNMAYEQNTPLWIATFVLLFALVLTYHKIVKRSYLVSCEPT